MSNYILDARSLIKNANNNIERNIEVLCPDNVDLCAQNILSQSRNLVEGFELLKYRIDIPSGIPDNGREAIKAAHTHMCSSGKQFEPLIKLRNFLEIVSSHYTLTPFDSESLLYKYSDLLFDIKEIAKNEFNIEILNNLDKFPFNQDDGKEYYDQIRLLLTNTEYYDDKKSTYYIEKRTRRIGGVYEYVLSPANDKGTKFDHLTTYSLEKIDKNNAISCSLLKKSFVFRNIIVTIPIISSCTPAIRPCEINKLAFAIGLNISVNRSTNGYSWLMSQLNVYKQSLYSFIMRDDFDAILNAAQFNKNNPIYVFLSNIHSFIKHQPLGHKTIRYLLFTCKHSIIKNQITYFENQWLGDTRLNKRCYAFETHPYSFSLLRHNPKLENLLECLPNVFSDEEMLKRMLVINTEDKKMLYTPIKELDKNFITSDLIESFNKKVIVEKTKDAAIGVYNKYVFIQSYENHTVSVIKQLHLYCDNGDQEYKKNAEIYTNCLSKDEIDSDKIKILCDAFSKSSIVLINGAAGTGKTTLLRHFSSILKNEKILFLSCTNSSIQNMRMKVGKTSGRDKKDFMTLERYVSYKKNGKRDISGYDILVVDECSMVANDLMDEVLCLQPFQKIILVGDEKQIESIEFGNWFGIAIKLIKNSFELSINHRTTDNNLQVLWESVRTLEDKDKLFERLVVAGYHHELDSSLFSEIANDEVILCLNYDGLYGINNINRYMQELNDNPPVSWKVWTFKKEDKILFNESYYFRDYFYNNQKGIIEDIDESESFVKFTVSVEHETTNNRTSNSFITWIKEEDGRDFYNIVISKDDDDDENNNYQKALIVPFQLGYAISIHKSQGLEYQSVKIVLTKEIKEQISLNVFYTAITRSKKHLKLYCDKSSLNSIIQSFSTHDDSVDVIVLKEKFGLVPR